MAIEQVEAATCCVSELVHNMLEEGGARKFGKQLKLRHALSLCFRVPRIHDEYLVFEGARGIPDFHETPQAIPDSARVKG